MRADREAGGGTVGVFPGGLEPLPALACTQLDIGLCARSLLLSATPEVDRQN